MQTHTDNIDRRYEKKLPNGLWIFFRLPAGTTDKDFQDRLRARGIQVPIDRISLLGFSDHATAEVSFERETLVRLLNEKITDPSVRASLSSTKL
jgi:hypothetical protein